MSKEITIAGHVFAVPQPFAAGHVLTEGEAKALNQTFAENIRNNMAAKVKAAFDAEKAPAEGEPTADNIADYISAYANSYEFTIASVAAAKRITDPIEREALAVAKELLSEALRQRGLTLAKIEKEARDAKIAEIAERPEIIKEAKKRVEDRAKKAGSLLEGLDLPEPAAEAEA